MSSKKEEKSQAAADRIKAAALSAAKGLSRAQAERAATAAARNVNAYGQKEEGPSRWQERKEAKRQMYLMSTEKAVKLGERKDLKTSVSATGGASSQCQKCFQPGHWTYECKNERVYISRPSRSQQLKNPLKTKLIVSFDDNPDVEKRLEREEKEKGSNGEKSDKKSKRKRRSAAESESESSEASVFETDGSSSVSESDYSSQESSSSYSSSDSEDRRRRKRKKTTKQKKRRHHKYSSSSESSESDDSASDSDSEDSDSRRKSKRRSRRH